MGGFATPVQTRTGGPFMAPDSGGYARTTQEQGATRTETGGGPSFGGGGSQYGDLLRKLIERKMAATGPQRKKPGFGARTYAAGTQTRGGGGERGPSGRVETPWYSSQGAATGPVGMSPGMIPGMGIDPRKLPPNMRPSGSSFMSPDHSTGSQLPPIERDPDALYGYSPSNPRAQALSGMMDQYGYPTGGGRTPVTQGTPRGMDPVGQLVYGTHTGAPRGGPGAPQIIRR